MMRMITLVEANDVNPQSLYWNIQGKSLKAEAVKKTNKLKRKKYKANLFHCLCLIHLKIIPCP